MKDMLGRDIGAIYPTAEGPHPKAQVEAVAQQRAAWQIDALTGALTGGLEYEAAREAADRRQRRMWALDLAGKTEDDPNAIMALAQWYVEFVERVP